ncbi:MAG: LTA synthase family protein [Bacteriovoracaceae bacterium]|nr:LTA synthase family protein [Bacteriovoracaceae bacterium]
MNFKSISSFKNILSRHQLLINLTALHLGILTFLRILFFIFFYREFHNIKAGDLTFAFYLGLKFDLRLILSFVLLIYFISFIPPLDLSKNKGKFFWVLFFALLFLFFFSTYATDFFYYSYLHTRLSSSILKFFENPLISLQMVWETYPVILLLFLLGILCFLYLKLIFKVVKIRPIQTALNKKKLIFSHLLLLFFMLAGLYGKVAYYPLRWSEAFFSPHSSLSNLALNPVLYIFDTLQFKEIPYDKNKVKENYDIVANYLNIENKDKENLNFKRVYTPQGKFTSQPNIVFIVLESMAAFKTGFFGNETNPTPYLDKLIKESLLFNKFYVPTIATARSIFTAVTSLPDVSSVKTSSRNPLIVTQHTLINELEGYDKFYFLGGSSNWGNIRGIFSHNIKNINIYDGEKLLSPRNDVWGVSDYHLFIEAHQILEKNQRENKAPFFAFIQTSGFHRPYSLPTGREGFIIENPPLDHLQKFGFNSLEEFQALRFQDYALGNFLNLCKKSSFYNNTLFFIIGDHGLPHDNASNTTVLDRFLALPNYHIPFIIHGPKFFKPQIIEKIGSEVDILPTILGLIGIPYHINTLGRDLFDSRFDKKRYAFFYEWYATPARFGLITDQFVFKNLSNGNAELYDLKTPNATHDVKMKHPEIFQELSILSQGLLDSSRYLLYHNKE